MGQIVQEQAQSKICFAHRYGSKFNTGFLKTQTVCVGGGGVYVWVGVTDAWLHFSRIPLGHDGEDRYGPLTGLIYNL